MWKVCVGKFTEPLIEDLVSYNNSTFEHYVVFTNNEIGLYGCDHYMQEIGINHCFLKKVLEDWKGVGGKHLFLIIYPLCRLGFLPISTHYFRRKILHFAISFSPLIIWEKKLFSKKEMYVSFGFLLLFLLTIFPWPHLYISNIQEGRRQTEWEIWKSYGCIFPVRITHGTGMFWKLVTTRYQTLC